jgi:hypothetical protein
MAEQHLDLGGYEDFLSDVENTMGEDGSEQKDDTSSIDECVYSLISKSRIIIETIKNSAELDISALIEKLNRKCEKIVAMIKKRMKAAKKQEIDWNLEFEERHCISMPQGGRSPGSIKVLKRKLKEAESELGCDDIDSEVNEEVPGTTQHDCSSAISGVDQSTDKDSQDAKNITVDSLCQRAKTTSSGRDVHQALNVQLS